eukprot:symbB.v1.2.014527.t1/scaffold1031.1/size143042/2
MGWGVSAASSEWHTEHEGVRSLANHEPQSTISGQQVQELPEPENQEEVRVDLEDPAALATFLITADIKLVRAEYLFHLMTEDRRLPRRQEAEGDFFVDRTGKTRSALVDHDEVRAWAAGSKEAIIASVSHAWEAREHPDPCSHQLEQVVSHAGLFVAAFAADIWLFFDYMSLFQFKRQEEAEERSFRRSMANMHAMYAHESTMTFRVESLTPEHRWQKAIQDGSQVTIFHDKTGLVKPVPLAELMRNTKAYLERGWCRAEVSWSSGRGDTAQHQLIDGEVTEEKEGKDAHLRARTPVAPDAFAADMHSAAFTHRSDEGAVIELQKKVFLEKVTRRRKLKAEGVSLEQMRALTESLKHFKELNCITLNDFRVGPNEAKAFVEALAMTPVKKFRCRTKDEESLICLVKAMSTALALNTLKITHLDLANLEMGEGFGWAMLGPEGAKVLAEALKENRTLERLNLAENKICLYSDICLYRDKAAQVLAEALKENRTLKRLNLAGNHIGFPGVKVLQEALETNTTLEHLELAENDPVGRQAVARACDANPRICKPSAARSEARATTGVTFCNTDINTEATNGSDEESQKSPFETAVRIEGLADKLRLNQIVTEVNLSGPRRRLAGEPHRDSSQPGRQPDQRRRPRGPRRRLAGEPHRDIRRPGRQQVWRRGPQGSGAAAGPYREMMGFSCQALASAMQFNETITYVYLDMEEDQLSDEGRQALQDIRRFCQRKQAQEVCRQSREVDLCGRGLGDELVKALADALRVNHTVTNVRKVTVQ